MELRQEIIKLIFKMGNVFLHNFDSVTAIGSGCNKALDRISSLQGVRPAG